MDVKNEIEKLKAGNQYRFLKDISCIDEKHILYKGKKLINLASNDYLGISTNKSFYKEFLLQLNENEFRFSSSSSRLLSGNYKVYSKLETLIAKAYKKEDALIFNSGYHANTGILPAITTKKDLIIADKLVHASLIDGFKLSDASFKRFKHKDYQQLISILKTERDKYKNVFIISESTFSMDGDNADLQQLVKIKKQFNSYLYIDEAHAVGVYGENGYGLCEEENLFSEIDFIVGTFGKALASIGAFVALKSELKAMLVNKSRSLIFTTALPIINLEWTSFIFSKLPSLNKERLYLKKLSFEFKEICKKQGININAENHIIPIITKSNDSTLKVYNKLLESGYFVSAVRPPTVPANTARIRLSLNSNLTIQDLENIPSLITNS